MCAAVLSTSSNNPRIRFIGAREDKHVCEHELYEVAVGGNAGASRAAAAPAIPSPAPVKKSNAGLIIGVTAAVCVTIVLAAVIISDKDDPPEPKEKSFRKQEVIAKDDDQPSAVPGKNARNIAPAETATAPVVAAPTAPQSGVVVNGRQLSMQELRQHQAIYNTPVQPGRYWLDGNTGNVGVEDNPQLTGNVRAAIQASRGNR